MASQYMAYKPSPIHKPLEISNLGHISLLETPFLLEIVFITLIPAGQFMISVMRIYP